MKLAEALILRADVKKRIEELRERLRRNAKVQEGDRPVEQPEFLLQEFERSVAELEVLIRRVNATNATVMFDSNHLISDAIAKREGFDLRIRALREVIAEVSEAEWLLSRSEIKSVSTLDGAALQRQLDDLSRQRRELDTQLQAINWQVELV
jgi:hypothetical protein